MRYHQPYGETDPNASYSNGNASLGQKGSIPAAQGIEAPQREIVHVIEEAGLTPDGGDNTQLAEAIRRLARGQGEVIWVEIGGTANELLLDAGDEFAGMEVGQIFRGIAAFNNTSSGVTVKVNDFAAADAKKHGAKALTHSDVGQLAVVDWFWDGTNFQLLNPQWAGDWRGKIDNHYGSIASIPVGWQLANGTNGTPNLMDKMIIGARQDDVAVAKTNVTGSLTQTGGATEHNHGGSTGGHALTVAQLPEHDHDYIKKSIIGGDNSGGDPQSLGNVTAKTSKTGGNQQHSHSISTASNLPPYFALALIMKM